MVPPSLSVLPEAAAPVRLIMAFSQVRPHAGFLGLVTIDIWAAMIWFFWRAGKATPAGPSPQR
jgi:hypothetical protein